MTRNFKAIGLVVMAAFALSAMTASAASAQQGKVTSDGSFKIAGTELAGNQFNFPGLPAATCNDSTFVGEKVGGGFLASGASELTVKPTYKECKVGFFPATVKMTTCDYRFVLGQTTASPADTYGVSAFVECTTTGDFIHLEVYSDEAHTTLLCSITFAEQGPISGLDVTDNTNGTGTLSGTATGIHATHAAGAGCPNHVETNEASYKVNVELKGENEGGGATNISLSHN